jgi:hypothetical protein
MTLPPDAFETPETAPWLRAPCDHPAKPMLTFPLATALLAVLLSIDRNIRKLGWNPTPVMDSAPVPAVGVKLPTVALVTSGPPMAR